MRESGKQFLLGTGGWFLLYVGAFSTLSWVAEQWRGDDSFWMWFSIFMFCGAAWAFWQFHKLRTKEADATPPVYIDARQFHGGHHVHGTAQQPPSVPAIAAEEHQAAQPEGEG